MTDLERILNMAVRMDAHDSRKARDIFDGRLREIEQGDHLDGYDPECAACHDPDEEPWHQPTAPLSQPACTRCGEDGHSVREHDFVEGAELQAGLEAAVKWERSQVGHGPDEEASDE